MESISISVTILLKLNIVDLIGLFIYNKNPVQQEVRLDENCADSLYPWLVKNAISTKIACADKDILYTVCMGAKRRTTFWCAAISVIPIKRHEH